MWKTSAFGRYETHDSVFRKFRLSRAGSNGSGIQNSCKKESQTMAAPRLGHQHDTCNRVGRPDGKDGISKRNSFGFFSIRILRTQRCQMKLS